MHQLELIENDVVIRCQMYIQYNNDLKKFYSFFFFDINVSILFFLFFIQRRSKKSPSLPFTFARYLDRSGQLNYVYVYVYLLHTHFWLILLFLLSCSNGHAILNRIREKKKENENRREWNGLNMSQHQLECNNQLC